MLTNVNIDAACAVARAVFVPYFGAEKIDDICAVIRGDKVAVDSKSADSPIVEPPMSIEEAVMLTGRTRQTLNYHARKGRIRSVRIKGSSRAIGYVAEDIRAILQGRS